MLSYKRYVLASTHASCPANTAPCSWENVREEFVRHLHQPVCLALLRNCSPSDPAAFALAVKLLTSILMQPKLRRGLKVRAGGAASRCPHEPRGMLLDQSESQPCRCRTERGLGIVVVMSGFGSSAPAAGQAEACCIIFYQHS